MYPPLPSSTPLPFAPPPSAPLPFPHLLSPPPLPPSPPFPSLPSPPPPSAPLPSPPLPSPPFPSPLLLSPPLPYPLLASPLLPRTTSLPIPLPLHARGRSRSRVQRRARSHCGVRRNCVTISTRYFCGVPGNRLTVAAWPLPVAGVGRWPRACAGSPLALIIASCVHTRREHARRTCMMTGVMSNRTTEARYFFIKASGEPRGRHNYDLCRRSSVVDGVFISDLSKVSRVTVVSWGDRLADSLSRQAARQWQLSAAYLMWMCPEVG